MMVFEVDEAERARLRNALRQSARESEQLARDCRREIVWALHGDGEMSPEEVARQRDVVEFALATAAEYWALFRKLDGAAQ